eukprot:CAMPEP_0182426960 /NCGR_PEP_ID=MMETSP1167-20130531/13483_1 /TAXON_ID=2988 /ORGANISM="Mallomonas Sp, Strain CCMP3275" /LENGTH=97 /DNA_ID=CAMNT_0024608751 /DNA_START=157 /DNA_END=450 /DNA_ORIENTATION=-
MRESLLVIKGGATKEKKAPKKASKSTGKKLSLGFMIKSFFSSITDPSYVDTVKGIKPSASESKSKYAKDKVPKKVGGSFSSGGGGGAGAMCGPGGCS